MADCCSTPKAAPVDCCCGGESVLIFACSGGSNVGQLTNEAAKKLDQGGVGKFYCLAGIGGDIAGMMVNAEGADRIIALDGCDVACARKTLERANLPISCYVVVTDEGVEKGHHFAISDEEVAGLCARVQELLA
ncbi:MAG: zinc-binding protein [Armatimonadetes bacterium]|nr:zinc-binding protein [Armatimonadota bacterium]